MEFSLQQVLIASIPPFLWAFMTFCLTKANRSMDGTKALFMFEVVGIPITLCMLPFIAPEAHGNLWLLFGLGIWQTFVLLLYFYALRVGQLAIVGTIIETNVIITVILSVVFLHESFYLLKFIAISAILIGVILLGIHLKDLRKNGKVKFSAGVLPTLLAAFGTGIYFYFIGISSRINGWYATSLGMRIMIAVTILVLFCIQRKDILSLFRKIDWRWIIPAAVFDVAAFSVFNYALTQYEISYVAVINAAAPVVSTILAIIFLKEKLTVFQIVGFLLVIGGIVALNIV